MSEYDIVTSILATERSGSSFTLWSIAAGFSVSAIAAAVWLAVPLASPELTFAATSIACWGWFVGFMLGSAAIAVGQWKLRRSLAELDDRELASALNGLRGYAASLDAARLLAARWRGGRLRTDVDTLTRVGNSLDGYLNPIKPDGKRVSRAESGRKEFRDLAKVASEIRERLNSA